MFYLSSPTLTPSRAVEEEREAMEAKLLCIRKKEECVSVLLAAQETALGTWTEGERKTVWGAWQWDGIARPYARSGPVGNFLWWARLEKFTSNPDPSTVVCNAQKRKRGMLSSEQNRSGQWAVDAGAKHYLFGTGNGNEKYNSPLLKHKPPGNPKELLGVTFPRKAGSLRKTGRRTLGWLGCCKKFCHPFYDWPQLPFAPWHQIAISINVLIILVLE